MMVLTCIYVYLFDDTLLPIHYKNQILCIFITYSLLEENVYLKFKKISKKVQDMKNHVQF